MADELNMLLVGRPTTAEEDDQQWQELLVRRPTIARENLATHPGLYGVNDDCYHSQII